MFLKELGIDAVTLPLEWSRHELAAFEAALPQQEAELVVYGYLPLMETANCIYKTMKRCRHGEGKQDLYLSDRYQKRFYVLTDCENCKNTILNSVPLSLHKEAESLGRYGNLCCRLRFTVESGRQTQELTEQFMRLPGGEQTTFPPKEFTTGHFRKGVL
ncbi:MAG: U32 family peptidase, partial [Lachnospiraceae bacterium]|nr:U32 family peptidase [Lachnospiraceae bacterium]